MNKELLPIMNLALATAIKLNVKPEELADLVTDTKLIASYLCKVNERMLENTERKENV